MKTTWTALLSGYLILLVAIVLNGVAMSLGMKTWYGLFEEFSMGLVDGVFLFVLYPASLGVAGILGALGGAALWEKWVLTVWRSIQRR